MYKISFCTVCMNRLVHLRETLLKNIQDNLDYPNLEFIVLDYNSKDGMENWGLANLSPYIESGLVKYYKTYDPKFFALSHSKNIALKLATGDILCMIDSDNFAGEHYAAWVNKVFTQNGMNTIITTLRKDHIPFRDQGGKLCFSRELLHSVKGFDESLVGYGVEDVDLANRLEKAGGRRFFLEDDIYLKFIGHSTLDRLKNYYLINNLENLYIQVSESTGAENKVLYLLKDGSFIHIKYELKKSLKSNQILSYHGWIIGDGGHRKGTFKRSSVNGLSLIFDDGSILMLGREENGIMTSQPNHNKDSWMKLSMEDDLYLELIMSYGECVNRAKCRKNDMESSAINNNGWGQATVYRNFNRNEATII